MLTTLHVIPEHQQNNVNYTGYVPVKAATKGLLPENRLETWSVTLSLNMIMGTMSRNRKQCS